MGERNPTISDYREIRGLPEFPINKSRFERALFVLRPNPHDVMATHFRDVVVLDTPPSYTDLLAMKDTIRWNIEFGLESGKNEWFLIRGFEKTIGKLITVPDSTTIHVHTHPQATNAFALPSHGDGVVATAHRPMNSLLIGELGLTVYSHLEQLANRKDNRDIESLGKAFLAIMGQSKYPQPVTLEGLQAILKDLGMQVTHIPWGEGAREYWEDLVKRNQTVSK